MSDCANAEMRDRLPALLHGTLPAAEQATVAAHLASCADCRAELALLESVRGVYAERAPTVDAARIARALETPSVPARRPTVAAWGTGLGLAMAAGVAAIVVLNARDGLAPLSPDADTPAGMESVATGAEAPPAEVLPGGYVGDLTAGELELLLGAIDELEAVPLAEPEIFVPELPGVTEES